MPSGGIFPNWERQWPCRPVRLTILSYDNITNKIRRHIDYCYVPVYPLDGTVMVVKEVEIESTSVHFKH